jgi:gas vesicle protein
LGQEHDFMNTLHQEHREPRGNDRRGYGVAMGFLAGTFVGAGMALWFAPRLAAELRERVTESARDTGQRITDGYEQVAAHVAQAADDVTRKGQGVRDDVADVVADGAHAVERFAKAVKTR